MKRYWSLALFGVLPLFGAGCGFAQNMARNVVFLPLYTCTEKADHHRHELLAREAWLQMATQFNEFEYSCDYRRGFVDGYTDYLDYGGTGEPPPVPPPSYRLTGYLNPDGLAAMDDWTIGFRHGAATAKASRLRELSLLPIHLGPVVPQPIVNAPKARDKAEALPPPKKVDPPTEMKPAEQPADKPMEKPVDKPADPPVVPPVIPPVVPPVVPGNPGDKPSVPAPGGRR